MKTSPRILALVLLGSLLAPLWASAQTAGTVPQFGHVVIVLGENAGFSQTYQSGAMPYLDSLAAKYGLATNYVADTHGSLYDYLMLTSGQTLADSPTATPSDGMFSADNIALDVQNAGKTWRDYVEDIDSSCGGLNSGSYQAQHDPLAYFSNINQANRVCFSQFATDFQNKALPNLSFLAPNACDDAETCPVGAFYTWLKTEIGPLLASSYFQPGGDGLLIITFDEDENISGPSCWTSEIESGTWCGGQVETVVVSPLIVSAGYKSTNEYHHENVLRLTEEVLGLTKFPGASADPQGAISPPLDMEDFFQAISGSGGSGSAPALVQVQNNIDASATTSYSSFSVNITTQPGDLLVAFCRESSNGTDNFTVTDSAGQAWA